MMIFLAHYGLPFFRKNIFLSALITSSLFLFALARIFTKLFAAKESFALFKGDSRKFMPYAHRLYQSTLTHITKFTLGLDHGEKRRKFDNFSCMNMNLH